MKKRMVNTAGRDAGIGHAVTALVALTSKERGREEEDTICRMMTLLLQSLVWRQQRTC